MVVRIVLLCALVSFPIHAFAESTGEQMPAATAPVGPGFADAANAFACNGDVAQATGDNLTQDYFSFGLALPSTATIDGIEVRVRANDGSKNNRSLAVSLSWDGGVSLTSGESTPNFRKNSPLRDYMLGGPAFLWGRAWTPGEFSDANFRVRVLSQRGSPADPANLDCIPVTVFYTLPTATLTQTPTETGTETPTETHTRTWTASVTATYTATWTATGTSTLTSTATATSTATPSDAPTDTPTPTVLWTPSGTSTPSATYTVTPTVPAMPFCALTPVPGCRKSMVSRGSSIKLKDETPDMRDLLIWKWSRGEATDVVDFGDPVNGPTSFALCVYDFRDEETANLVLSATLPPGGTCSGRPCWKLLGSKGYKYSDRAMSRDGVKALKLKAGVDGKAKILVRGKGENLTTPLLPLAQNPRIVVQLTRSDDSVCWDAVYGAPALTNRANLFREKSD